MPPASNASEVSVIATGGSRSIKQKRSSTHPAARRDRCRVRHNRIGLVWWKELRLAFDPATGMYPTATKHSREGRRLAERGAEILGEALDWSELTPAKVQLLAAAVNLTLPAGENLTVGRLHSGGRLA
jgi:hypothetical protein